MTLVDLAAAIQVLVRQAKAMPSSRELAVAITSLQTAGLWIVERISVEDEVVK